MPKLRVSYFALVVCLLLTWRYTLLDPASALLEWLDLSLPAEAFPRLYALLEGLIGVSAQGVALAALACGVYLIVRRLRCSKTVCLLLWAVVALRLLFPIELPSSLSLFNVTYFDRIQSTATRNLDHEFTGDYQYTVPEWKHADEALADGAELVPTDYYEDSPELIYYYEDEATGAITAAVSREDGFGGALALVWLGGIVLLLGYSVASYALLKRRLRFAVKDEHLPGVWYSDRIASPCVVGIFRPRIYLTFGLSGMEREHILLHERQHIKNGDHRWKLLAWLVVCVHWMTIHPLLLLLFYATFLWNVEEACDQRVLRLLGEEHRAEYGTSLLTLSTGTRFRPGPIAFGEGDTEHRIRSILRYKKPLTIGSAALLIVVFILAISLGTDRAEEPKATVPEGVYQIYGVVCQSPLSSATNDYFLEQSQGTVIHLSPDLFSIEGKGFMDDVTVPSPVYQPMSLGDTLPNWVDEAGQSDPWFDIGLPEGIRGWEVLTGEEEESGYHVFTVSGSSSIWVGKWATHGTASTISEYWYLVEAAPADADPEPTATPGEDTPTATISPEGPPPEETELNQSDWEDLVLTWYIPLDAEDPMEYGFPLFFSFPRDYFNASCAGGTPYAYSGSALLYGHPIENAKGSTLRWWPYEEGSREPAENASITAGVYKDGKQICACSLLINLVDVTDTDLVYSVRATLHGSEGFVYVQSPDTFGAAIHQTSDDRATLAEFSVDLTHDGVDETVTIMGEGFHDHQGGHWDAYRVLVRDAKGRGLWSDGAGVSHAGQNGIYLYEEDGTHYLMNWCNYAQSGDGNIWYTVFSLTETGEQVIRYKNSFHMDYDSPLGLDLEEYEAVNEESIHLLSNSIVLASTNGDTPDWEYCSTSDRILTPILQEDYLIWWTPEELEAIQAKAQGTYTFRGEVVNIFEDFILVEDQSLWAPDYMYYFTVPVEDPEQFFMGDKVEVTADGPLYRRDFPAEGTHITVEKLS